MTDQSNLDKKYFIDENVYNCPFCNRNNITYEVLSFKTFNWSNSKNCTAWYIKCTGCKNVSMHLTYSEIKYCAIQYSTNCKFYSGQNLDDLFFHHQPTSFFTIDQRIPSKLRNTISEAEGSIKMNFFTGASACIRKSIYDLLVLQAVDGKDYEEKIKNLKNKHPIIDPFYFDTLAHIQGMASNQVHEKAWEEIGRSEVKLFLETLKIVLHEIYVLPDERARRIKTVADLKEKLEKTNKKKEPEEATK